MTAKDSLAKKLKGFDGFRLTDDLQPQLETIIQQARDEKGLPHAVIDGNAWCALGAILATYFAGREDVAGFLSLGQRDALVDLRKRAAKVSQGIEKVDGAEAGWFMVSELDDAGLSEDDLKVAISVLDVLSKIDPSTPHAERAAQKEKKGSKHDFASSILGYKPLRSSLQVALDDWWVKNTGLEAKVYDTSTAYQDFLQEIFGRMNITFPPGSSASAVKDARRDARAKEQRYKAHQRRFAEWFASPVAVRDGSSEDRPAEPDEKI